MDAQLGQGGGELVDEMRSIRIAGTDGVGDGRQRPTDVFSETIIQARRHLAKAVVVIPRMPMDHRQPAMDEFF
jgi:hypothetical protein